VKTSISSGICDSFSAVLASMAVAHAALLELKGCVAQVKILGRDDSAPAYRTAKRVTSTRSGKVYHTCNFSDTSQETSRPDSSSSDYFEEDRTNARQIDCLRRAR
jgi:hypothetical protein